MKGNLRLVMTMVPLYFESLGFFSFSFFKHKSVFFSFFLVKILLKREGPFFFEVETSILSIGM